MTRAEEIAERLQRESGQTLDDYPFTGVRSESAYGLDKLRGVQDERIRKQLWDLYWLMEAKRL